MKLAIWLLVCILIVLASGKNQKYPMLIALTLWVAVPWNAGQILTGLSGDSGQSFPSIHPGSILVAVQSAILLVSTPHAFAREVRRFPTSYFVFLVFVGISIILTVGSTGAKGVGSIIYTIVIPVITLLNFRIIQCEDGRTAKTFRNLILVLATAQAMLALVQSLLHSAIFYEKYYSAYYWWQPTLTRAIGTMDHPLHLSLFLAGASALALGTKSNALRLMLPILFAAAVAATGSRTGLLLIAAVAVWAIVKGPLSTAFRFALTAAISIIALLTLNGIIFTTVYERFINDSGSGRVRDLAYDLFFQSIDEYILLGGGATHSYQLLQQAGLTTSFESTFLTFAIDFGAIATLLFFTALCTIALTHRTGTIAVVAGGNIAFIVTFIAIASYSGGSVQSTAMSLMWLFAGISSARVPAADLEPSNASLQPKDDLEPIS